MDPPADRRVADLDLTAEPHLAAWRRGELGVDQLRRILASLIADSDVPELVARRAAAGRPGDLRLGDDLAEQLRTLLVDKMLPPSTTFDPELAGSVRGWAWNFASTAAGFQHRDLTRFYQRFRLLATGEWTGLDEASRPLPAVLTQPPVLPATTSTPALADPDHCDDVADAVRALRRGERDDPHLQAEALLTGLALPAPTRLPLLIDRDRVRRQLGDDATLGRRSLVAYLRSHHTDEPVPADIDPLLMTVWAPLTVEQASLLAGCSSDRARRHLPAHTVALSACSPLPRPSSKRIRSFVTTVTHRAGVVDDSVRDAAAAFVEAECEPVARHATTHHDLEGVLRRHQHLRRRFDTLIHDVAALESVLGDDPDQVRRSLTEIAHDGLLFGSRLRSTLAAVYDRTQPPNARRPGSPTPVRSLPC